MDSLGLNPVLLIAQLISFTILFYVLNRFLYPVVKKALNDRREAVAKTFSDREEIEKRLADFSRDQQAAQKKALEETRKLLAQAKSSAAATREDLLAQAAAESQKLVAKAQDRIAKEEAAARDRLETYTRDLADKIVAKVLADKATNSAWQKHQTRRSLDDLSRISEKTS